MTAVTELRRQSEGESRPAEIARIESQLSAGVQRLVALAEAYPEVGEQFDRANEILGYDLAGTMADGPAVCGLCGSSREPHQRRQMETAG